MVSLIKTGIKLFFLVSSYALIIGYMADLIPIFVGMIPHVLTNNFIIDILVSALSTISWIFSILGVKAFLTVWLMWPVFKFGIYIYHKFVSI